jgi:hypothetical protein
MRFIGSTATALMKCERLHHVHPLVTTSNEQPTERGRARDSGCPLWDWCEMNVKIERSVCVWEKWHECGGDAGIADIRQIPWDEKV